MAVKERLDVLLVNKNLISSRESAKANIIAGNVFVEGIREIKPGTKFYENVSIVVKNSTPKYVSRGGFKLEKAISEFQIELCDTICFDIGASTGGFTDCMLQNNARMVYAVDVGYGQLDWKLRCDDRVICMEKTNVRYLSEIEITPSFASIDVSFISLNKVISPVFNLMADDASCVALIKPQFEAGRDKVGKKGVVRDMSVHRQVIHNIIDYVVSLGLVVCGLTFSPIKGPNGNIEYLLYFSRNSISSYSFDVDNIVTYAHKSLSSHG